MKTLKRDFRTFLVTLAVGLALSSILGLFGMKERIGRLEEGQKTTQRDIQRLGEQMEKNNDEVRTEMTELRVEMRDVVAELRAEMRGVSKTVSELKGRSDQSLSTQKSR